ncbi:DNA cytosine methyltransferase, partial [Xanthomonas citri]
MADGSHSFNFPVPQVSCLRPGEIVVDLFAGGGGASEALKQALGVDPALAYNHDEWAIGMHAANHPLTIHHREDIWHADPRKDVAGRPIGWFHASPDCTHFSQAKGGQPRSYKTRALSWVALKWIGQLLRADLRDGTNTAPRILSLENVWQILTWGPLVAKRCKVTGRVLKMDGTVAARGERVPVANQQLVPDKRHSGRTWRQFVAALESKGYRVEWRKLTASDYGAGTSRERLFLLARRDGEPIVWPAPTHGTAPGQQPRVRAADCLDFSLPCPSIFTRKRPLADATLRRIAKGVMRHVLQSADPFIVPATHQGSDRVNDVQAPLPTITAANRGELMLVAPELAPFITAMAQNVVGNDVRHPLPTVLAGANRLGVVSAFLEQANGGFYEGCGRDAREPMSTITATGSQQQLATAHLITMRKNAHGQDAA